ncbi:MAG: DUF4910 domain-containing protein [Lachnospiraceae bacterium]|nr:DUF4910 domain-containing protein [Lachnospiraceae bacterium]
MDNMFENGKRIYDFAAKIFPIARSITGDGVRKTLSMINEEIAESGYSLNILEIPSGTAVFDWTVPKEWVIREAYIENENHEKIIDFKENNLHVLGYSIAVDKWVPLSELLDHVYTEETLEDAIPYVTSYYKERYGFCMSENMKRSLKEGNYHMYIDSELKDGSLTIGELIIPSTTGSEEEIMISTYTCHPSMANNECSGPALSTALIRYVASLKHRRYAYRFIFNPETIGSISYLSLKLPELQKKVKAGFVLSCVGDDKDYSFIPSRYSDTLADMVIKNVLSFKDKHTEYSFLDRGSDERQYCSPGVDLPFIGFCRSKYGCYPEYHTSKDDMTIVSPSGFEGSYSAMCEVINALEYNLHYKTTVFCEPQLGKRGLYPTVSKKGSYDSVLAMRDLIGYSDGRNSLIEISNIIKVPVKELIPIVDKLMDGGLLTAAENESE